MSDERRVRVTDKRRAGPPSGDSELTEIADAPEARVVGEEPVESPESREVELLDRLTPTFRPTSTTIASA